MDKATMRRCAKLEMRIEALESMIDELLHAFSRLSLSATEVLSEPNNCSTCGMEMREGFICLADNCPHGFDEVYQC